MINFCTLFDSNYLLFGLNMYYSLSTVCDDFHLYIFAFDDKAHDVLTKLNLQHTTLIPLSSFEDEDLLRVKPTRSRAEYCWTCTPSTVSYAIKKFGLANCTYIDADLFFYRNPKILIDEMKDQSVMITSHRYTPKFDQSRSNGIYCVQFVTFKNNEDGMKVLQWWRDACIEWCYDRFEDGKFGDQKYLDYWQSRFKGVHELQHLGGGVAPWNVQQYEIYEKNNELFGSEKKTGSEFELIFYHFHGLKFLKNDHVDLCKYPLDKSTKELVYQPYLQKLLEIKASLRLGNFDLNLDFNYSRKKTAKQLIFDLSHVLQGRYQIYPLEKLI